MKYVFKFEHDLHTYLRCLLWNAPKVVLDSVWGVMYDGATMYSGVSNMDDFIPVDQRVTNPDESEYLYCCKGEILMQRAALASFHDETIIRRIDSSNSLGYDTDIYVRSIVFVETDSQELYEASMRGS